MRILVATSDVPFVEGGHRVIARALVRALQEAGHDAEVWCTPQNRFGRQFAAYTATRCTDLQFTGNGEKIDRLISLRFPSYALKHPDHICWLNHRMREYYDLWEQWSGTLSWKGKMKESIRRTLIHKADGYFLKSNLRKLYAQSVNIQNDLLRWGNIRSEVLYPPPPLDGYFTDSYGDFIFSPSRLTSLKRVSLLLEALSKATAVKAIIAGDGPELPKMNALIRSLSLQDRVQMIGQIPENKMLELYAKCRAVFYAPFKEDYGLVTLEAFHSRKPVLTASDSGGPTELVQHGKNGFVVPPDPGSVAEAITTLFEDSNLAERLGTAGHEDWKTITWPETIRTLLS